MTDAERSDLGRSVPFGESGRALLVREFLDDVALSELFASAELSTFLPSPWNPATDEFEVPIACMAIGCYNEEQVQLFYANEAKIAESLERLGYRFFWITAGMCV